MRKQETPSGLRLISMLKTRWKDILSAENGNDSRIHIYCIGGCWVAFERSAYHLQRLCPHSEAVPVRIAVWPFPLVMVSVTDTDYYCLCDKIAIYACSPDHSVASMPEIQEKAYEDWHRKYNDRYQARQRMASSVTE